MATRMFGCKVPDGFDSTHPLVGKYCVLWRNLEPSVVRIMGFKSPETPERRMAYKVITGVGKGNALHSRYVTEEFKQLEMFDNYQSAAAKARRSNY